MKENYQKLCNINDIEENQTIVVEINERNIMVAKIKGEIYAFDNNCTHENIPLTGGQVFDGQIQCPHHGARFDIKTGKATQFPAVMELKTYKIEIDKNNVMAAL